MNGKDLEKALLWEAPHIGEKAPEQIPEALREFSFARLLSAGDSLSLCAAQIPTLSVHRLFPSFAIYIQDMQKSFFCQLLFTYSFFLRIPPLNPLTHCPKLFINQC